MEPSPVPLWKWLAVTAIFTLALTGAYALGGYAILNPSVVHKHQLAKAVTAAVGSTDAVKIAEKRVEADGAQNGVTVTGFKVVSVTAKPDQTTVVRLRVETIEVGTLTLDVTLTKSVYSVQAITRAG